MILSRFISKFEKKRKTEDLMEISRHVKPLINRVVDQVFQSHIKALLTGPIDYIVPAVWGTKQDGELDMTQREIFVLVNPIVHEVMESLKTELLTGTQAFCLEILIRELLISKIAFLVELAKNLAMKEMHFHDRKRHLIEVMEPWGSA